MEIVYIYNETFLNTPENIFYYVIIVSYIDIISLLCVTYTLYYSTISTYRMNLWLRRSHHLISLTQEKILNITFIYYLFLLLVVIFMGDVGFMMQHIIMILISLYKNDLGVLNNDLPLTSYSSGYIILISISLELLWQCTSLTYYIYYLRTTPTLQKQKRGSVIPIISEWTILGTFVILFALTFLGILAWSFYASPWTIYLYRGGLFWLPVNLSTENSFLFTLVLIFVLYLSSGITYILALRKFRLESDAFLVIMFIFSITTLPVLIDFLLGSYSSINYSLTSINLTRTQSLFISIYLIRQDFLYGDSGNTELDNNTTTALGSNNVLENSSNRASSLSKEEKKVQLRSSRRPKTNIRTRQLGSRTSMIFADISPRNLRKIMGSENRRSDIEILKDVAQDINSLNSESGGIFEAGARP